MISFRPFRTSSESKKGHILIASYSPCFPLYQGDSMRLAQLINYLRGRDWRVTLVHSHAPEQRPDYPGMARLVDELIVYYPDSSERDLTSRQLDDWCPNGFAELVAKHALATLPDVVLAQFSLMSKCLERLPTTPGPLKILDADNVFANRRRSFDDAGLEDHWVEPSLDEEIQAWNRADMLLAIQPEEYHLIRSCLPHKEVCYVPFLYSAVDARSVGNTTVLTVANDNRQNLAGLQRFIETGWPLVRARYPDARFVVIGRSAEALGGNHVGVELVGPVRDLVPYYRAASVVINTTPCGTGLKCKSVEALAHGKCLVSLPAGVEGLPAAQGLFIQVRSMRAMGRAICRLFKHPAVAAGYGDRALLFATREYSPHVVGSGLETAIVSQLARTRHLNPVQ